MSYTLYNKTLKKSLIHPKIGLWYTNDLEEAKNMLASCLEYCKNVAPDLKLEIIIVDAETGKEI